MKLSDYRKHNNISVLTCAQTLNVADTTIRRWEAGDRNPQPDDLKSIFINTDGLVEPNDFYPLDEWREEIAQNRN